MANPIRRGESSSQVSSWAQSDRVTPNAQTSFILPHGLTLRHTVNAGTTSVTIPSGITWVYAICVGAGGNGGGGSSAGGGAGGIAWGWTLANSTCIVGTTGNPGNHTRYGHIIAGGGGGGTGLPFLGGAGNGLGTATGGVAGATNYWGMPGGAFPSGLGSGGGGGNGSTSKTAGLGISGGGGGGNTGIASPGASGLAGGGGGGGAGVTAAAGGNGINILTGAVTTGGAASGTLGGGGAGVAGNGASGSSTTGGAGGLGGGGGGCGQGVSGPGGAGILYIFY